jgi:hypothetical protein
MEELKKLQSEYEEAQKAFDTAQKRIEELEKQLDAPQFPIINGKPCDLHAVLDSVSKKLSKEMGKRKKDKKSVGQLLLEEIKNV